MVTASRLTVFGALCALGVACTESSAPEGTDSGAVAITCGELLTGSLNTPGEVDRYRFEGTLFRDVIISLAGEGVVGMLVTPAGIQQTNLNENSHHEISLTARADEGTWVIEVFSNAADGGGSYSLGLTCLPPQDGVDGSLACGKDLLTGAISEPAEVDVIEIDAGTGALAAFTALAGDSQITPLRFHVRAANEGAQLTHAKQFLSLDPGSSSLVVLSVRADELDSYRIGFECVSPPSPVDGVMTYGNLVGDSIDDPVDVHQYTFEGEAGRTVTLTVSEGGFNTLMTVFAPSGWLFDFFPFGDGGTRIVTLPDTGTYVVQISSGDFWNSGNETTGNYWLGLESLLPPAPVDANLACEAQTAGAVATPTAIDQITMSVQAAQTNTLSLSSAGFQALATLYAPDGTAVTTLTRTDHVVTLGQPGTYVIQVRAADFVSTGSYTLTRDCG